MTKVLYIGGYGRSGSTMLDAILGNHAAIFGGGELEMLFRDIDEDGTCTCGDSYHMCALWGKVLLDIEADLPLPHDATTFANELKRVESTFGRYRNFSALSERQDRYGRVWSALFESASRHSGASIVVDSSKSSRTSARRILGLARNVDLDVYVIHLIRDPRAVLYSEWGRGNNDELERGRLSAFHLGGVFRPLVGWLLANLAVSASKRRIRTLPVLRVRYEDLVLDPHESLDAIGEFVGIDLASVADSISAGEAFSVGHGVRGNRMRRSGPIRLRLDSEWIEKMSPYGRRISAMFAPFARLYGFDTRTWPDEPDLDAGEHIR